MRTHTRRTVQGLALAGGVVLFRPGTRAYRIARRQVDTAARYLRLASGRLEGISYHLRGRQPDPAASGVLLADRVRSALGPLEKHLDLPHVNVMAEDHVVLLHGEVGSTSDAEAIEAAVAAVSGVQGVESYLHVGLTPGETRPSAGRAAAGASAAFRRLIGAATSAGVDGAAAPAVVRGILGAVADRIPEGERDQVATHLPADVRPMFSPPRRLAGMGPARTVAELVGRITATTRELPPESAARVTRAVVGELRALVPEEAGDVAAVLPAELRALWEQG